MIGVVARRHPIGPLETSQAGGRVRLAIALSPMPSSARTNKGWAHERDAESALCQRRVRLPEVSAVIRARKVDRRMAGSLSQVRLSWNVNGSLR